MWCCLYDDYLICLQDNEYLASLLADREREMNALKEAEVQLNRDEPWKESLEKEVVLHLLSFGSSIIHCPHSCLKLFLVVI